NRPLSPLFAVWSGKRDHALMNAITFGVPGTERAPKIPLSAEGLNLVRCTFRHISLKTREELLKDANVRVKAEQDGWNIGIDENDVENVQMAFAEVLTIAVATNWNEEVKSYIPRRSRRHIALRGMDRMLQVEAASPHLPGAA
ncbi:hypothetical protein FOZ62_030827, partial [Perkinsus olseni]